MRVDEYKTYDMIGLAGLVAKREVTASQVLEAALACMAEVNPKINAIVVDLSQRARDEAAGTPTGPLAGAPYLLKDHNARMAGVATSVASKVFKDVIPPQDSAIVAALRRAGVVIFGKTNLPELSLGINTDSELYGPARNPWDLERSPGGSSGGSAAAVAAGIVPAAHGSDGTGSIRLPAAWTGLFGLKPSRGRLSYAPMGEGGSAGSVVQHALTRSVRDSAALLDAVCRPIPGDPYWLAPPERPFLEEVGRPRDALRIGFTTAAMLSDSISPECEGAVLATASLCESLGHKVEEVQLPTGYPVSWALVSLANVAWYLEAEARRRGRPIEESELAPLAWYFYQRGLRVSASDYLAAVQEGYDYGRKMAAFFEGYDVILTSTTGTVAPLIEEMRQVPMEAAEMSRWFNKMMPNTGAFSITGQPAMSVPLAWSRTGLPIGLQFVAKTGDEATLFRLAGQLEQAQPWADRRPPGFE